MRHLFIVTTLLPIIKSSQRNVVPCSMSFHSTKWQNAPLKQRQAISWANSFCRIWHERDKGLLKERTWSDEKSFLFVYFPAPSLSGFSIAASLRALSRRYRSGKPAQHCDLIDYLMAWNANLNCLDVVQSIVMLDFKLRARVILSMFKIWWVQYVLELLLSNCLE